MNRAREELQAEREREVAALSRANQAEVERDRALRIVKRQARLSEAGACPCCKRTFQQLARHMAAKHPEQGQ